ncbi:MAG TPA: hypothetical protein VN934_10205 [Candidatus Tumulicola sp.]|nr:hypothetical protein [Candidatus Tumulicola sp.]
MKKLIALVALVAVAAWASIALAGPMMSSGKTMNVKIAAQNDSYETGKATLTAAGAKTKVVISIKGEPAGASQPAHIHTGTCAKLGGVVYPLTNVVGGTSTTWVNASLSTIKSKGTAINLHQSAKNLAKYVACGQFK